MDAQRKSFQVDDSVSSGYVAEIDFGIASLTVVKAATKSYVEQWTCPGVVLEMQPLYDKILALDVHEPIIMNDEQLSVFYSVVDGYDNPIAARLARATVAQLKCHGVVFYPSSEFLAEPEDVAQAMRDAGL